jgi:predicted component of viral defense system (DUF524 family)
METTDPTYEDAGDVLPVVPSVFTMGREQVRAVPDDLRGKLGHTRWIIYEWTEFQVSYRETTHLRIGSQIVAPTFTSPEGLSHFRFRFENELGVTTLQALRNGTSSHPPIHLEVIAKKFPDIRHSLAFMDGMLTDLFARGAALPYSVSRRTKRTIRDERRSPNDLFAFHFFRHHHATLIRAIQAIHGSPHRVLSDRVEHVRIHEVKRIDSESLLHMLQTANAGTATGVEPSPGQSFSPLHRLQPERVLQRIPEETFDTPENRFVLSIARRMLATMRRIRRASWFPYIQDGGIVTDIPETFDRLNHHLRQLVTDPRFAALEESVAIPAQSRVLQHKDGYRELTQLWDAFHRYQEPVYEKLERAIDLRDVPTLYEFWLLFELIDGITKHTGVNPVLKGFNEMGQPDTSFRARFDGVGALSYQRGFARGNVYSGILLKPDFVWETVDGRRIILDAKFALSYPWPDPNLPDDRSYDASRASTSDITKMHAYRDAIRGVSAAVVLYPGATGFLKSPGGETSLVHGLGDLIKSIVRGDLMGIGAIPMSPDQIHLMGGH